jgi:hypothetical protein
VKFHIDPNDDRWPYVLDEDVQYVLGPEWKDAYGKGNSWVEISKIGVLMIHARVNGKEFRWDGASGPAIDTITFFLASLIHDALYQLIREGILPEDPFRSLSDAVMRRVAKDQGMGFLRRWWTWAAVRLFGGRAVRSAG